MKIEKNMGRMDRTVRFIVGFILVVLFFLDVISGTLGTIAMVFAVILLGTSVVGVCGLYLPFQYSTCEPD